MKYKDGKERRAQKEKITSQIYNVLFPNNSCEVDTLFRHIINKGPVCCDPSTKTIISIKGCVLNNL